MGSNALIILGLIAEIFMFGHDLLGFIIIILISIAAILAGKYIGRSLGLMRRPRKRQGSRSDRGYLH